MQLSLTNQQNLKDILDAAMVSTPEEVTFEQHKKDISTCR